MSQKIFCGSARTNDTQYGKQLQISFSEKDIGTLRDHLNERGWVNLYVCKMKEPKGDRTHYLQIATSSGGGGGPARETPKAAPAPAARQTTTHVDDDGVNF